MIQAYLTLERREENYLIYLEFAEIVQHYDILQLLEC